MPYVRQRGNQLAIVHGERDPETKKVEQRILFTVYSKAEAQAMLGRGGDHDDGGFRMLLEPQYPDLKFDWKAIRKAVAENLDALPETYTYREERLQGRFRQDLAAFARQLALADPQHLLASAQLIQDNREELLYLADLISWRLKVCERKENEWNRDNPFYWRFALQGREVPPDAEEHAIGYWERRELKRTRAVFGLLVEAFEGYADGHNYLGLVAEEEGRLDDAIREFEKTIELGRRLFPKRIAKSHYWTDLSTRPYMRGLQNLALVLNRAGRFDDALSICEKLEGECGDDVTATAHRVSVYMNTSRWQEAADAAMRLHRIWAEESLTAALAFFELGRRDDAMAMFLHGALNHPRAARMLMGERIAGIPKTYEEVKDHNAGVSLLRSLHGFLAQQSRASRSFFREIMRDPRVVALIAEAENEVRMWHDDRSGDRKHFDRMNRLHSPEFARMKAGELGAASLSSAAPRGRRGKTRPREFLDA